MPRPPSQPIATPFPEPIRSSAAAVAGKKALGHSHAGHVATVLVSDTNTALAIEFADGHTRVIRRTTTQPVRSIKGQRPRSATSNS